MDTIHKIKRKAIAKEVRNFSLTFKKNGLKTLLLLAITLSILKIGTLGGVGNFIILGVLILLFFTRKLWENKINSYILLVPLFIFYIFQVISISINKIAPLINSYARLDILEKYAVNDMVFMLSLILIFLLFQKYTEVRIRTSGLDKEKYYEIYHNITNSLYSTTLWVILFLGIEYMLFHYPIKPTEKLIQAFILTIVVFLMRKNEKKDINSKIIFDYNARVFLAIFALFSFLGHYFWKFFLFSGAESTLQLMPDMAYLQTIPILNTTGFLIFNILFAACLMFYFITSLESIFLFKSFFQTILSKKKLNNIEKINYKELDDISKKEQGLSLNKENMIIFFLLSIFIVNNYQNLFFTLSVSIFSFFMIGIAPILSKKKLRKNEETFQKELLTLDKKLFENNLYKIHNHNMQQIMDYRMVRFFVAFGLIGMNFLQAITKSLSS